MKFQFFRKLRSPFLILSSLFFVSASIYIFSKPSSSHFYPAQYGETALEPLLGRQIAFWNSFHIILDRHPPNCPSPGRRKDADAVSYNAVESSPRPDLVSISDEDVGKLKQAHANFVEEIRTTEELKPIHHSGTRGIVSLAGPASIPFFLAQLRMLRRSGSFLPVEVFFKDESAYEAHLCEKVIPQYHARCVVLSDILGSTPLKGVELEPAQLKTLALLFSSFEEVLWMDWDCFPLHKVDDLLDSDLFQSTGLVTWPDLWASTISPQFYQISQQEVPAMTLRASSTSSVFLLSKRTHFLTTLLAAYYSQYGPSHYFTLLRQGAPGEGNNELFTQAALAAGEPLFTVSERVGPLGKPIEAGISSSAMAQSDPIEDFRLTHEEDKWRVKDPAVAKAPRIAFIHASWPKFSPEDGVFGYEWNTGKQDRMWVVGEETIKRFGYDVERIYLEEVKWVACNFDLTFRAWNNRPSVCNELQQRWSSLFEGARDGLKFTDE
jgi:alpha 1,2-mannosyltransferase